MNAYITSIGEPTTDLCEWSLKRLGFTTIVIQNDSTLWSKLRHIFSVEREDFLRVDADVVCNKNVLELVKQDNWWYQAQTFDWFKQDTTDGGIQFIKKECIPIVNKHMLEAEKQERPESYLYRLDEFHNPRRCETFNKICGMHGYGQNDTERVKATKRRRGQFDNYDWELAEKLT